MVRPGSRRWTLTPDVVRAALHDPATRRLLASWMAINAGRWAYLVTNLVFAYDAGGSTGAAVLGLASFLAPTVLSPFAGLPTRRWRPEQVLVAASAIRALAVALTVVLVALDGPLPVLFGLVALEAAGAAFGRPMHHVLLPLVARSPAELVAAGAGSGAAEGIGVFLGPALTGALLVWTGPVGAYLGVVVAYALGLAAIAGLTIPGTPPRPDRRASIRAQLAAGGRAFVAQPARRALIFGVAAQTSVRGALTVLTVAAAIDLLGMGGAGAGALNAALGAGGFLGALASIALAGRRRLAPSFAVALVLWGAPIAVIGLAADATVALLAMVVIGTSNAVLDVSAFTLILRTTPHEVRAPVLGLLYSAVNATQAAGGFVAPVLIGSLGIGGALIATGLVLPVVALVTWPAVRDADRHVVVDSDRLDRIRADPLFAPLSMAIVEQLAGRLTTRTVPAGTWLMREGDRGDSYYLIDRGRVEVTGGGVALGEFGPGDGIGEIALIRDVPRTASVRALTDVDVLVLARDDFLEAVTGHPGSAHAADTIVEGRLAKTDGGH